MSSFNSSRLGNGTRILSSQWGGLSDHLIARFFPVKRVDSGNGWEQSRDKREISAADKFSVDDGYEVHCPITDGNQEMTLNWQSPFENTGAESKFPSLSGMLQSGSMSESIKAFFGAVGMESHGKSAADVLASVVGRTGITKLNSTQIFSGMPPAKLTMTLHFRALIDPIAEVHAPIQQLEEWSVPQYLSSDGLIANAAKKGTSNKLSSIPFPSMSPQIIGMKYAGMMLMPLVIESIGKPITAPRSQDGVMLSVAIPVTLATLTALDRRDIRQMYL